MPTLVVNTNVSRQAVLESLPREFTQKLAKATSKPAQYIVTDQLMSFGGSAQPSALCSLHSIGKVGGPQIKAYSKSVCDLLTKHLQIPADRVYINYDNMKC
ncbi:macrophage migration inhibitory factor-like [Eublepharis macularius]|uniref:Macrophage migration inhibitory factor n=1 Tax=Eublepharis macularius TaxID=481883 RepID=A0AA97LD56_EUBMA|nr:macrophage migration inhibitory factor-like [Eublepharis macularius]